MIEFALLLPVLILLPMGLIDQLRRNLAAIDVDAAALAAALHALRHDDGERGIAAAVAAQDPDARLADIAVLACDGKRACAGLPPGRYLRIAISVETPSLFGPLRSADQTAVATVRIG